MKRPGIVAAGAIGAATSIFVLFSQHMRLGASEEGQRSFREAVRKSPAQEMVEQEDGVRLNYFDSSWEKVLQSLAESQQLTLVMKRVPPGRFARRDKTRYDLNSAIRILNAELEPQGFRLLRQNGFLIVLDLDEARTEYSRPRLTEESARRRTAAPAVADEVAELSAEDSEERRSVQPQRRASVPASATKGGRVQPAVGREAVAGKRIRPVSGTSQGLLQDAAAAMEQETLALKEGNAADVARTLFVVFRDRAELEKPGLNGLPGFVVRSNPADGSTAESAVMFRVGINQDENALIVEAPTQRISHLRKLVTDLDRPADPTGESAVKVVPNENIPAKTAAQLNQQIHQLVSLADEQRQESPAEEPRARTLAGDGDESPAINLRGDVTIQALEDLKLLLLKGNAADVDRVEKIIQQLEKVSVGSLPSVHLLTLENVDSEALANLMTDVYEQLAELRQRTTGNNQKTASFLPVVQPNALLIISSEVERESILELAVSLDKPLTPDLEFEVFPLKSAIASQVVTSLGTFYADRPGLGTSLRTFADVRTNSVVVQARPNELAEVRRLIERIDSDEPSATSRMKVIRLKNAVAEELSATISEAIQSVISPPQQNATQGGAGFGNTQGSQELRDNKSVAVEFLSSAGGVEELIRSGILADVRVSFDARSNSLIVSATEASMGLMEALVRELDQAPGAVSEIKVFTLQNADAQQSVDLLTTLFESNNTEDALGIQLAGTEGSSSSLIPLRFSADIRTNTVLAIGSAESLSVVEAVLLRLDSDDTRQRTTTVIPLRNAPVDLVSQSLLDFLEQQQSLQTSSEDLISNIERIRQEVLVAADTNSNSLIVSASPQYFNQVIQIIDQLDAQPPEVVIQALLVEVSLDATDEFGIELGFQDPLLFRRSLTTATTGNPGLNFNQTNVSLGNNSAANTSGNVGTQGLANFSLGRQNSDLGFGGFVFSAQSDAVSVLLRALASRRTVQVLSRPQVRATHNNEAYVTVGQLVPVVNGVTQNGLGTANPNVSQQQVGITLRVTPRITPDGVIAMSVFADKSSLSGEGVPIFTSVATGSISSPIINQSQALTTVNVPNGQTIVIGGMITKTDETLERKVPWLGDLPIVGRAFRYDGTTSARTELLIFLTPRIVLSDLDSELVKQVESERMHFIESEAEAIHGPLYSVPGAADGEIREGDVLTPDSPVETLLEPDGAQVPRVPKADPGPRTRTP